MPHIARSRRQGHISNAINNVYRYRAPDIRNGRGAIRMTQALRNDEIEDEELGLQMQSFNHGDPQSMKSLTVQDLGVSITSVQK